MDVKKRVKAPHYWTKVQYFTLCKASTFCLQNVVHPLHIHFFKKKNVCAIFKSINAN